MSDYDREFWGEPLNEIKKESFAVFEIIERFNAKLDRLSESDVGDYEKGQMDILKKLKWLFVDCRKDDNEVFKD